MNRYMKGYNQALEDLGESRLKNARKFSPSCKDCKSLTCGARRFVFNKICEQFKKEESKS